MTRRGGARIRVGINLLWLVPGEVGGSEEYTVGLLRALAQFAPDDTDIVLYVNRRFAAHYPDLCERFTTRVAPVSGGSRPLRVLCESTWLAWRSRRDRCALVHHGGGTMPTIRSVPGIVTLHDLQPLVFPERFGVVKRTYIRLVAPRSLRAAKRVVCLSQFVGDDAVLRAGVDGERIALVSCGVDPGAPVDPERQRAVRDRHGLGDRPIVLYPAITYPHKNHVLLIEAFACVSARVPEARLVLTGGAGSSDREVADLIVSLGLSGRVVRTGRVDAADFDAILSTATVLAFPSLYEGFGLPALEAMGRDVPVVAAAVGGLAEVVGDAGTLLDPTDPAAWCESLVELLTASERRESAVRAGRARVGHHGWPASASALADVYRSVAIRP